MTSQADLHVHSKYSGISPDWYFRLIQSPESYTEVKQVYSHAIKRGQTFVTITDHDQIEGALLLKNLFPERVFTGVECNVFFPEDHCKVHILVYGLDESQYKELMIFRKDIYQFRDYLRQQNLAYSVAHALMAVDDKLSRNHLEKLILLFDVFEGINGSQLAGANKTWMETLRSLTPKKIDTLYRRYHINPISQDPWIKGFTGGSDDHTDLFIGRTYTEANADTVDEFLEELKEKRTNAGGSHGTIQDLSMSLIKMAYKLGSKKPDSPLNHSLPRETFNHVFEGTHIGLKSRVEFGLFSLHNRIRPDALRFFGEKLTGCLIKADFSEMDKRPEKLYKYLMLMTDEAILDLFKSVEISGKLKFHFSLDRIKTTLAGLLLALPFYSSLGVLHSRSHLGRALRMDGAFLVKKKKTLWFVDDESVTDFANGLYDLDTIFVSHRHILGVLPEKQHLLPILKYIHIAQNGNEPIPIPSLLKSLDELADLQPDEIIISTSSPVGMIGLVVARFLKIPCSGFYFGNPLCWIDPNSLEPQFAELLEQYNTWFFDQIGWLDITPNKQAATIKSLELVVH